MTKQLIVNADDYGRTAGVSRGIRQAHLKGLVTSTTALMTWAGVEEELRTAQRECPRLGLGVHLCLTSGRALLPAEQAPTLTPHFPDFPGLEEQAARLAEMSLEDIRAEWQAQIERFCAVTGQAPDHLDSHHHFSYAAPELFEVMLQLAFEYDCPVRFPHASPGLLPDGAPEGAVEAAARYLPEILAHYETRHPDRFIDSFYDETATLENLLEILGGLEKGTSELMCHPGYADAALNSSYAKQRERELALLTDPLVLAEVDALEIQLVNFSALQ